MLMADTLICLDKIGRPGAESPMNRKAGKPEHSVCWVRQISMKSHANRQKDSGKGRGRGG